MLGTIPTKNFLIDKKEAEKRVLALAESCNFKLDTQAIVDNLSVGEQQRIEILKALYQGTEILILDEPTAVLTSQESHDLFRILRSMTSQGQSIIFITHKLREALLADKITILRAGRVIAQKDAKSTTENELVEAMFEVKVTTHEYKPAPVKDSQPFLEIQNLFVRNDKGLMVVKGVSFDVLSGEIMGIAGVAGNGQKEFVESITGLHRVDKGMVLFKGEDITNYSPKLRREKGMVHIPEERIRMGMFSDLAISDNLILGKEDKPYFVYRFLMKYFPIFNRQLINTFAVKVVSAFSVMTKGINAPAKHLSGGNIQKMVLARELAWEPELVIAAQPTRGLDAKTAEFVHQRLLEQRGKGKATLMVSYDLDEILKLSDRIGVMYDGSMTIFCREDIKRREIERMMVGAGGEA